MTKWLMAAALMLVAFPFNGVAQSKSPSQVEVSKESLIGTWKLVSYKTTNEKGEMVERYGPNPVGFLTYTTDGRMSIVVADSKRKPLSLPAPSVEERAEAFSTFIAYAGTYTVTDDKVIHHIEVTLHQAVVNTTQERSVKLEGDRLTLRGGWLVNGVMDQPNNELVWERLKPETSFRDALKK